MRLERSTKEALIRHSMATDQGRKKLISALIVPFRELRQRVEVEGHLLHYFYVLEDLEMMAALPRAIETAGTAFIFPFHEPGMSVASRHLSVDEFEVEAGRLREILETRIRGYPEGESLLTVWRVMMS